MKTCSEPNCNRLVFGGHYCKYHQYRRKMQGGDQHKRKTPIKKRTPKRAKDERQYKDQAREFFNDAVKNGTNICVFCGKKVMKFDGLHHWKGRTNDYLLDKKYWSIVHNECHVDNYHWASTEQRMKQVWWDDFLIRLKAIDEDLWRKELKKYEKVNKLNPKIWDEEEDLL